MTEAVTKASYTALHRVHTSHLVVSAAFETRAATLVYRRAMVDRFNGVPYSFGALLKTFGPLYLRCDVCRRYAPLYLAELRDVDYRTKSFSCSVSGAAATLTMTDPRQRPAWATIASTSAIGLSGTRAPSTV
jgi:hypothetical protein